MTAPSSPRLRCPRCDAVNPIPAEGLAGLDRCGACRLPFSLVNGILCLGSAAGSQQDYPDSLYSIVAEAEARHFWFGARNDIIQSVMNRHLGRLAGVRLLDVGCGTGFALHALERAGVAAWGVDMHLAALVLARKRVRGPLVWSQAARLPFLGDFDAVSLFDVIEHALDDASVLSEACRVVRPGGVVVITVPAGPHLWTRYDSAIGHKRRYTREAVESLFARIGLHTLAVQYFNCLPALVQRAQRWLSGADSPELDPVEIVRRALSVPPRPVNVLLRRFLPLEAPLGRLPFVTGASVIAVGRRTN